MKDSARRGCLAFLAALAAACALAPAAGAVTLPQGFQQRHELTGLSRPTKIAWAPAPDGRRFVAEKDGVVRVAPATGTASQVLLDIRADANEAGDRGLLGLAVDSDFANHPYLYLLYTYDLKKATNPDTEDAMVSRLLRVKVSPTNQVLEQKTLLGSYVTGVCPPPPANTLDCIPADGTSHSIGTVLSAPDGTLFVGNGDAAGFTDLDPLSLRTYDEASMAGKIMHVDREGKGLPGHPFCPTQTNLSYVCTKLWAKGFRNPFRFTRRPNGFLMVADVGWNNDEEISAVWRGGRSFGWPCYEGVIRTPTWVDRPECETEYAKEFTEDRHDWPIYAYAHQGSSAILAGPEYPGGSYPDDFDGTMFFGDYAQGFLRRMRLDSQGGFAGTVDFATEWHGTDLTSAPNGDLTWAEPADWGNGNGSIERVTYAANRTPTAVAGATPVSGEAPLEVQFNGAGSSDPDGDALTYDWNFGDGTPHSSAKSPVHTYADNGTFRATLTVHDGSTSSDSAAVDISVSNTPPVPSIDAPANGSLYRDGVQVNVRGSARDDQDGVLSPTALEWQVVLHHSTHTHPFTGDDDVDHFSFTPIQDHDADSHYEITLTARDADGASASKTIAINPQTIQLHLRSEPAGAPLSYAGASLSAPADRTTAIGFKTGVSAAASFQAAGSTWVFDHWSDGGERAHEMTVPATETTLTAVYSAVNRLPTAVAEADPESGEGPLVVGLDGSGSSDPDGDSLTYDWDFGDGSPHSSSESPDHTYANPGSYTAKLTVSDGTANHTDTVQIDVSNGPAEPADPGGPLIGPMPGPPLNPQLPSDRSGPRVGFNARRGVDLRHHLLKGTADDGGGVKAVSVALARVRRHGCQWLVAKPRRLARKAGSCARPRWIPATVSGRRWKVRLSKTMSPGAYRVRFKASDMLENRSERLRDGRASVALRLSGSKP